MSGRDHRTTARATAVSWQCRLLQLAMHRLIKPRITLAHGVRPLRRTLQLLAQLLPRAPRGITRAPRTLGGVAGEWTRGQRQEGPRSDESSPVILHFHGGAFVAGSPRLSRAIVWQLAARCGGGRLHAANDRHVAAEPRRRLS